MHQAKNRFNKTNTFCYFLLLYASLVFVSILKYLQYCCASQSDQANEKLQNKLEQLQHHAA